METRLDGDVFARALRCVAVALDQHVAWPAYRCVRAKIRNNRWNLLGGNGEIFVNTQVEIPGKNGSEMSFLFDPIPFLGTLNSLEGEITLTWSEGRLHLITSNGRFSVAALPADEYPDLQASCRPLIRVDRVSLINALARVLSAGVLFRSGSIKIPLVRLFAREGRFYVQAMNHIAAVSVEARAVSSADEQAELVLSTRAAAILRNALSQVDDEIILIESGEQIWHLDCERISVAITSVGTFPDVGATLRGMSWEMVASVEPRVLQDALHRIAAPCDGGLLRITARNNALQLEGWDDAGAEALEIVPATVYRLLTTTCDMKHFIDMVSAVASDSFALFVSNKDTLRFNSKDALGFLVPVRHAV